MVGRIDQSIFVCRHLVANFVSTSFFQVVANPNFKVPRETPVRFGIESSHSYERTHIDSVLATERMVDAYLKSELVD